VSLEEGELRGKQETHEGEGERERERERERGEEERRLWIPDDV
jgi:hypothetical protein